MIKRSFPILLLAAPLAVGQSLAPTEQRAPTEQERASFEAFYQQHASSAPASASQFTVSRAAGSGEAWQIEAVLSALPRRALRDLCRMERTRFVYDGAWSAGRMQQFAWQDRAGCKVPAEPIALAQRMPDTDILALIGQQGAILKRARLLFAGNTACAPQRAYNYTLAAVDVSAFINGSEEMATLTYRSDRGPQARVWVRRSGLSYDPWNVSC
jgi:hypothetical protein